MGVEASWFLGFEVVGFLAFMASTFERFGDSKNHGMLLQKYIARITEFRLHVLKKILISYIGVCSGSIFSEKTMFGDLQKQHFPEIISNFLRLMQGSWGLRR